MIVKESLKGLGGKSEMLWLVSCKDNAHSNRSVNDVDEPDISDRVLKFNCQGFMGFYSTIPSSALANKLHNLKTNNKRFDYIIYDSSRISNELLSMNRCAAIIANFFPNSYEKYSQLNFPSASFQRSNSFETDLNVVKTALIILEIDKIEEDFEKESLSRKIEVLNKLFKYYKHRNEEIANSIFDFFKFCFSVNSKLKKCKNFRGN